MVHAAFHRPDTTIYRWVNGFIWLLIVLSVALFVVELGAAGSTLAQSSLLVVIDNIVLSIFAAEIVLRTASLRPPELELFTLNPPARIRVHIWSRVKFALQPMNLIDLIVVLAVLPELRGLRALRLLRLLRALPIFPHSQALKRVVRGFDENRLPLYFVFSLIASAVVIGGLSIYLVEVNTPNSPFDRLADGFWWALVTITTVGYGDITPATDLGRVISGTLMVGGMVSLALMAGIIGHTFLNSLMMLREEQYRMANQANHVVICGYTASALTLLHELSREVGADVAKVIIAPHERPPEIPPEYRWVRGDPTKEREFEKVQLYSAARVVVVARHELQPQEADSTTLMTIFTLRSFMARHAKQGALRKKHLWVVAEIREGENVAHARTAGADEVIEAAFVGYSMMAHSVAMPGTAAIMTRMATAGALNLYLGRRPPELGGETSTFGQLAAGIKKMHGALLIGVRIKGSTANLLNPPDDQAISADSLLIYLAKTDVLPPP